MCIFTIEDAEARSLHAAGTRIFARLDGADQLLAYQMSFTAARDVYGFAVFKLFQPRRGHRVLPARAEGHAAE